MFGVLDLRALVVAVTQFASAGIRVPEMVA
jgi:hypothetical protein